MSRNYFYFPRWDLGSKRYESPFQVLIKDLQLSVMQVFAGQSSTLCCALRSCSYREVGRGYGICNKTKHFVIRKCPKRMNT